MTASVNPYFDVLNTARSQHPSELKSISRDQLVNIVISWLLAWERASCLDHEAIDDAGALVGDLNYEKFDSEVYAWAMGRRGSLAHEIAGAFLGGLWRTSRPSIDLSAYLLLLDRLPTDGNAFWSVTHALRNAVAFDNGRISSETKTRVIQSLARVRDVLVESGLHPGLVGELDELRPRQHRR